MSKLTLHVDDELIAAAEETAAARHTTVSKLVSGFFETLATKPSAERRSALPPVTRSLIGCIRGAGTDITDYIDELEAKHS